ncbi:MAG: oligosaccharide flippase family protein, partial [Candidatus Nanoarchaeia archaeon]
MRRLIEKHKELFNESLYRNSIYLMLSSVIMAGLGFFFWTINARLFSPHDVGLATTLISAATLLVSISGLGLGMALIRFLPSSKRKSHKINSCLTVALLFSIIVSTIFLLGIKVFSPGLAFVQKNLYHSILFIVFTGSFLLFTMVESVFLAYRDAKYIVVKNTVFSIIKLVLPMLLIGFGSFGIFGSWGIAALLAFVYSVVVLVRKFYYEPKPVIYDSIIKRIGSYSFGNYVAGFLGSAPTLLLPIIITNKLGAEMTAYYYIPMMIAGLLFVIPTAVSQSLFAEGSSNKDLKVSLRKSVKLIALLLIPAVVAVIVFGKYLLGFFGSSYSANGYYLLLVLAVTGFFVALKSIYTSILNIKKKILKLVLINLIISSIIIG